MVHIIKNSGGTFMIADGKEWSEYVEFTAVEWASNCDEESEKFEDMTKEEILQWHRDFILRGADDGGFDGDSGEINYVLDEDFSDDAEELAEILLDEYGHGNCTPELRRDLLAGAMVAEKIAELRGELVV